MDSSTYRERTFPDWVLFMESFSNPRQPGHRVTVNLEAPGTRERSEGTQTIKIDSATTVHFEAKIPQAARTAETPNLYPVIYPDRTSRGKPPRESFLFSWFPKTGNRGNQFLVNEIVPCADGSVNYHEHDEHTGHVLSEGAHA